MKFKHLLILILGGILLSNSSCKKYPDGPRISFRTKKARVVNTWKLDEVKVDGFDDPNHSAIGQIWEFAKDNEYTIVDNSGTPYSAGSWELNDTDLDDFFKTDKKTRLIIREYSSYYSGISNNLKILKLKHKAIWLSGNTYNGNIEYHFVPK
jgi:hypothetical protein